MQQQEESKQDIVNFLDYSITLIWLAAGGIVIGVIKKVSDFLILAAIEKYDARIEAKIDSSVKKQLEPVNNRLEKLAVEIHSVVSKHSVGNLRAELLLQRLEQMFDKDEEK